MEALRKAPDPRFDEKTIPDFGDFFDVCKKKHKKIENVGFTGVSHGVW